MRGQPDHQVSLQGGGVIAKGVPADRKIQFFGLPDYEGPGTGPTDYEEGSGDEDYEYEYEEEDESRGEENDGMSMLDKVILATILASMSSKVVGMVGGRKNGSMVDAIAGVDRRNKVVATEKGAVNRVKNAGNN